MSETAHAASPDPRYQCGRLIYTKAGLFTLFSWLLWGDFCFSLMETIWPNILPLMLKSQGTPNTLLSLVITTIPSAMNFVMNPIISTASDRYRGRRGRRIPFLLVATPFITVFLILLGFSRQIGLGLHATLLSIFPNITAAGVTIAVICALLVGFRFFELFVNTVFWYLFNDVVPSAFMGRFLGFFRVVGSLSGALFHFFLYRYAESHTSWIFFGVAILYGSAFMLMCFNVKEGSYPPPDTIRKDKFSLTIYLSTFFKECFSHRIFRLVFTYSAAFAMCNAINTFMIFMAFSIGLDLASVGKIAGVASLVSMLLMYPMGSLVDRFHPLRVMFVAQLGVCLVVPFKLIFLFYDFPKDTAFWVYAALAGIALPMNVANTAAALPMIMRIFPHERFGQFSSANAMCAAVGTMAGGVLAGLFLDLMKSTSGSADYYYRYAPIWSTVFMILSLIATSFIFREWKRLGGDSGYKPPISDKFATIYR